MRIPLILVGGASVALEPKVLPDNVGTLSVNQNPVRGDLRPWRTAPQVASVPAGRQTIYRMGRDVVSDSQYWLSWTGVVHAVRGMVSADTTERTYYTGDGVPKWTDNTIGLSGSVLPSASRQLGVPVPVQAVVLSAAGGTSTDFSTRFYTYTFVTDKGEESAPAPVKEIRARVDDVISISNIQTPPGGSFTINRVRIYRTQSADDATASAEFFFLREIAAGGTAATDDNRALGEVLPSTGWLPPPEDLTCLLGLWSGMMAGISGGAMRLCVPYTPYAWPIEYEIIPPDAKAIALGKWGQNCLLLTNGRAVRVTGVSPEAMDDAPLNMNEACVSVRSVVSFDHGVVWACPDGLAYFGDAGAKILTQGIFTREDWQAMNPATMVGGMYEGLYFGIYTVGGVTKGFLLDPVSPTGVYSLEQGYRGLWFDELQDQLYVLDASGAIRKWNAGTDFMSARFVSKVFRSPSPTNFAAAKVIASDFPVVFTARALSLEAGAAAALVAKYPTLFTAPTPTSVQYQVTVTSQKPFRLPSGFTATDWQFELSTAKAVQGCIIASDVSELGAG